jgi:hypothetical protein
LTTSLFKLIAIAILAAFCATAQETPISYLKLRTTANAGGFSITNLNESFPADAGVPSLFQYVNGTNVLHVRIDDLVLTNSSQITAAISANMTNIARAVTGASGTVWRAEWSSTSTNIARAITGASGTVWRAEWLAGDTNEAAMRDSAISLATNTLAIATESAALSLSNSLSEAYAVGGYAITNWWEPAISAIYRATSAPTGVSTSSYIIYSTSLAESGFVDWLLDYTPLDGWIEPPTWAITDGTNHAYIATNRVWATSPGRVTVAGTGGGITRTSILPINYGKIATPIFSPARFVPGSAAAIASDPIIYMASNYLATTTDVLYPRPNSWHTNEMARTNYAAVIDGAWNTNCWLTNAASVFACASVSNGWGATLISPSVFVSSRHINIGVGSTRYWLTPEGAITSAVVASVVSPFPYSGMFTVDIQFGILDRPMPTNMIAYVATQAQLDAAFPAPGLDPWSKEGEYLQGVAFNQHLDASLIELAWFVGVRTPELGSASSLSELFHPAHPGDSSRPIFLLWGNKPVFLANYYYAYYGSSIAYNIAEIEAVVQAEGESLTYIDFEEVP